MSQTISTILGAVATGTAFGFAMEKSKVYHPEVIQAQMLMQDMTMMKAFLGAALGGATVLLTLLLTGRAKLSPKPGLSLGFGESIFRGYGANVVGGLILGIGMAFGGACPGTVFAQLGAGVQQAATTILGGFVGAYTFSLLHNRFSKLHGFHKKLPPATVYGKGSPIVATGAFAAALIGFLYGLESVWPAHWDAKHHFTVYPELTSVMWHPIVGGLFLGAMQLPANLLANQFLGTSTGYCSALGAAVSAVSDVGGPGGYLGSYHVGHDNLWRVVFDASIVAGSYLSVRMSGFQQAVMGPSLSTFEAFVGGFMLLFGARMAGGCTSGHGISGMPQLAVSSVVTVAMMFVGGMGFSFARQAMGF